MDKQYWYQVAQKEAHKYAMETGKTAYIYEQAGEPNWSPYRDVAFCDSDLGTIETIDY
jgi:hypothetical protein